MAKPKYKIFQDVTYANDQLWNWSVWIDAAKVDLDKIDYVRYRLHPSFPDPEREVHERSSGFRLSDRCKESFTIYVEVVLLDKKVIKLTHQLALQYSSRSSVVNTASGDIVKPKSNLKPVAINIRGEERSKAPNDESTELTLKKSFDITAATRGEETTTHKVTLGKNDVVEFQFDDGTVWISDPDTIDEVFPGGLAQKRGVEDEGVMEIPVELYTPELDRGLAKTILLKAVKIFTKKKVLGPLVHELAEKAEKAQLGELRGLLKLDKDFVLHSDRITADGTYLLFIHGTASSTDGSFGKLKEKDTKLWDYVHQTYDGKVIAFQHETLTQSPLENVLNLIHQLPPKATLHIITHSRGGIVGDILNRFCSGYAEQKGFSADERNYLRRNGRDEDIAMIEKIDKAVLSKNITVEKFIRVACPASGTTLASKRLDYLFNIILSLIAPAVGATAAPAYLAIKDLIVGILETKNDTKTLPGIEAMNPDSPLLQMLNNPQPAAVINTPLFVVAGNAKLSLQWKALLVIASKLFYLDKNDFVVDTRSMYNGAKRTDNGVQYFFDEGSDVSHFNYFENAKTKNALLLALQSTGEKLVAGYTLLSSRKYTEDEVRNAALGLDGGQVFKDTVTGKKPIVVLLPGIMGSNLSVKDEIVWINYFRFITGSLRRLECSAENNKNVKAASIIGTSYKKITEELSKIYDVVTFPYDWRLQLNESAKLLNNKLIELMQYGQPIKLIGHSMGGVLVRDFIINYPDTWKHLNATSDFRLLFLGSPLGGSYRIPYVLFGKDAAIKMLDFIDRFNSKKELLDIFSQMPGLLSLLPLSKDADFAKPSTWQKMRDAFSDNTLSIPSNALLTEFGNYRDNILEKSDGIDFTNAAYIAGQSRPDKETISGYTIKDNTLVFLATKEGDESVTWDTGIPKQIQDKGNVYFSDVAHGELANQNKLFGAIKEILETGATTLLKKNKPLVRGLEKEYQARDMYDFDTSPEGVNNTVLGLGDDTTFSAGEVPVNVTVSNGHLQYAAYPLMVGHFLNDGILSAERSIDEQLDHELSKRHRLGIYPGPIGTSNVLISENQGAFRGALVIGLGKQGELTGYQLTRTVEQGITNYLSGFNSTIVNGISENDSRQIGISSLIVGCGYGGLSIETCVLSILQGIQNANDKIRQIYPSAKTVSIVEFVELYRDRALSCVHAINTLEKDESRTLNIIWKDNKIKSLPARRERLPVDNTNEWWTRITVRRYEDDKFNTENKKPGLWFTISTDAAREEERMLKTNNETIVRMLDDISIHNKWSVDKAKAFFELLIPNDFKDQLKRQSNINWILDKHTAAYPWELLQDSSGNSLPLSVNAGMIRQLATKDYRLQINTVVESNAFVVGDPDLKGSTVPQLPGALKEGKRVDEVLSGKGYSVTSLLRSSATDILLSLFSKNYKIVHLAGHGIFNEDPAKPSGMLIGDNVFLTTSELSQMSTSPELVFVNCCYLGQTSATAEEYNQRFYRLAANIGTQLIENGVKVVIVAGWAVDDASAFEFTERFYQCMFQGDNFGDAIRKARKTIFDRYSYRTNTWGAYQCYGDPFYTLDVVPDTQEEKYEFVIEEEAEIELTNLLNRLEAGNYDPQRINKRMDAIDKAINVASVKNGRTLELQALIYSALDMYGMAIEKFKQLLQEEKASYSFSALEQYCNLRVKFSIQEMRKPGNKKDGYVQQLKEVIPDLIALKQLSETPERLNILGSTYKRLGIASNPTQKKNAYIQAALYYKMAFEHKRNDARFYPLTNWLTIENALVLAGIHKWGAQLKAYSLPTKEEAITILKKELKTQQTKDIQQITYWDIIAVANLLLCLLLIGEKSVKPETVLKAYKDAWKHAGNEGHKRTEIEYFEFLMDVLAISSSKNARAVLAIVTKLKPDLEAML
jgi:transcription initiation factor IIF auxiliary subunit